MSNLDVRLGDLEWRICVRRETRYLLTERRQIIRELCSAALFAEVDKAVSPPATGWEGRKVWQKLHRHLGRGYPMDWMARHKMRFLYLYRQGYQANGRHFQPLNEPFFQVDSSYGRTWDFRDEAIFDAGRRDAWSGLPQPPAQSSTPLHDELAEIELVLWLLDNTREYL